MSELKFKAYGELEISEALSDASHVIIEENGDVKRFPANSIGKVKTVNGAEPDESGNVTVQPDFSQNDPTAPDYVKNRPFYTGDPVETVVVEERTESFSDPGHGIYIAQSQVAFEIKVGETYKVYWDGAAYECPGAFLDETKFIGNLSIGGVGSDTGEPFLIGQVASNFVIVYAKDTSDSHTFSISELVAEVVKIDEKYLPDTIIHPGGCGDSTGGGLFKVTITGTENESRNKYTYTSDKTGKEVYDAFMSGLLPYAELIINGETYFNFVPCANTSDQYETNFIGVTAPQSTNNDGKILVSAFFLDAMDTRVTYAAHVLNSSV